MNPVIISAFIGIVVFLIIINVGPEEEALDLRTEKRLNDIKNKTYEVPSTKIQEELDKRQKSIKILTQDTAYSVELVGKVIDNLKAVKKIKNLLKIADINITIDMFILFSLLPLGICFLIAMMARSSESLIFILIGIFLAAIPFILAKLKIGRRLDKFTQQFPDALGLMCSSLRAGHSLNSSFQMVAQEMPYPMNQSPG